MNKNTHAGGFELKPLEPKWLRTSRKYATARLPIIKQQELHRNNIAKHKPYFFNYKNEDETGSEFSEATFVIRNATIVLV